MRERTKGTVDCRTARKRFEALDPAAERHLKDCARCAGEYRLFELGHTVLDLAATPEPVRPDEDFFRQLRARIARGPDRVAPTAAVTEDSWAAAIWLTARQIVPVMAMLLLLIIGATLLWSPSSEQNGEMALRPRERVLFSDMYDYPAPTPDDVLETLVSVEEKENGK
jgi:nitrogen fixation-related uncharacterized protein